MKVCYGEGIFQKNESIILSAKKLYICVAHLDY
jgi:hypothetical protein